MSISDDFTMLQSATSEALQHSRGNQFDIPHIKKEASHRGGNKIIAVMCESETILKDYESIFALRGK